MAVHMKDEQRFEMQPKIVGLSLHFQIFSFPYDAVDFALCAVREEIFMEILITAKHIIMFLFGSENRNILYALITLVVFDYITGVCVAIHDQKLSSAIGAKGISKKVMIFILISMSYIADNYFLQAGNTLETVTILFYCANEAISIIENAAKIGIPVPEKLKNLFNSFKEKN